MRTRWAALLTLLALTGPAATAEEPVTLELRIGNVQSSAGQLLVVLYAQEDGFPGEPDKAIAKDIVAPRVGTTVTTLKVPAGRYAAVVVHDVNGNGECDMRWPIPIPKEPIGVSRDARGFMGPPKFRDAVFEASSGTVVQAFSLTEL